MLPLFQFALIVRFDCSINAHNLYSMRRAGKVYPHEVDIQETHPGHRKLDSQSIPTCFAMPAGSSWPMMATTRAPCSTTSGTRTSNTRSGTPTWRPTGSKTFGGTEPERRRQRRRRRQGTRAHYPRDRQAAQGVLPRACRAPAQAAAAAPVHARPLTPVRPGVRPG